MKMQKAPQLATSSTGKINGTGSVTKDKYPAVVANDEAILNAGAAAAFEKLTGMSINDYNAIYAPQGAKTKMVDGVVHAAAGKGILDDEYVAPQLAQPVFAGLQNNAQIPSIEAAQQRQQEQAALARNTTSAAANIPVPASLPTIQQPNVDSGIGVFGNADPQKHAAAESAAAESAAQGIKDAITNPLNSAGRSARATVDATKYIGETMGEGAAAAGIDTANFLSKSAGELSSGYNGITTVPTLAPTAKPEIQPQPMANKPDTTANQAVPVVTPVNPKLQNIPTVDELKTGGAEQSVNTIDVDSSQQINKQKLPSGTTSYYGGTAPQLPRPSVKAQAIQQQTEQSLTINGRAVNPITGASMSTTQQTAPQLGQNYFQPREDGMVSLPRDVTQSATGGSTPQERFAIQQSQIQAPTLSQPTQQRVITRAPQLNGVISDQNKQVMNDRLASAYAVLNNPSSDHIQKKYAQKDIDAVMGYDTADRGGKQKAIDSAQGGDEFNRGLEQKKKEFDTTTSQHILDQNITQSNASRSAAAAGQSEAQKQRNWEAEQAAETSKPIKTTDDMGVEKWTTISDIQKQAEVQRRIDSYKSHLNSNPNMPREDRVQLEAYIAANSPKAGV